MRGDIFDLALDDTLPILDGKFSAGLARDNFKNSEIAILQIVLDGKREAVTSIVFSFNSEKRYNWYFSNSLPPNQGGTSPLNLESSVF